MSIESRENYRSEENLRQSVKRGIMRGEHLPTQKRDDSRVLTQESNVLCILKTPSSVVQFVCLLMVITLGVSCDSIQKIPGLGLQQPKLVVHDGNPITLITTPFTNEATKLFGASEDYVFNFHFDPKMVELANVESYALWTQDREGGDWQKVKTSKVLSGPMRIRFPLDGAYGLRASAIYKDGREVCVPSRTDRPLVWLHVDREAPQLYWISPNQEKLLPRDSNVSIRWGVSEMEFENKEITVSQSSDGGKTWHAIDILKGRNGEQFASWKTPGFGADSLWLKVSTEDFVGNQAEIKRVVRFEKPDWGVGASDNEEQLALQKATKGDEGSNLNVSSKALNSQNPNLNTEGQNKEAGQGSSTQLKPISYTQESADLIGPPRPISNSNVKGNSEKIEHKASGISLKLKNLKANRPLAGGIARYLFFTLEGSSPMSTSVQAQ